MSEARIPYVLPVTHTRFLWWGRIYRKDPRWPRLLELNPFIEGNMVVWGTRVVAYLKPGQQLRGFEEFGAIAQVFQLPQCSGTIFTSILARALYTFVAIGAIYFLWLAKH